MDWDEGVAPGPRRVDLAHAIWCFVDVGKSGGPVEEQARRIRLMCEAYRWDDPPAIVDEIATLLRRARDRHASADRRRAVAVFDELMRWMAEHGDALRAAYAARP